MLRTSEFILNFVLNSCWQIAAVVAVSALASLVLRNAPARYRHVLWVVALAVSLIVPLLTATGFAPVWLSRAQTVPSAVAPVQTNNTGAEVDLAVDHIGSRRTTTITTTPRSVLFLTFAYTLFILGRAIRLTRFWRRKERLRRTATRTGLTPELEAAANSCRARLGIKAVTVTRSHEARVPYTLGARRPLMYRTAWVLCGDHHQSEDLVQHVLTKLYVAWPRVSRMDSVDGYVRKMLVNANLDRLRRRRELTGLEEWDRPAENTDTDALIDLRDALRRLAPGQRRALVLRHLWGLSVDETAAALGVAPGTVKSQTADAMTRLRTLLTPHSGEGQP